MSKVYLVVYDYFCEGTGISRCYKDKERAIIYATDRAMENGLEVMSEAPDVYLFEAENDHMGIYIKEMEIL